MLARSGRARSRIVRLVVLIALPAFVVLMALPAFTGAQDTARVRRDSVRADSIARLKPVTVVAAPAERSQPVSAIHVDASSIRVTPSNSPYDLLRQTAGVEVHQQGQGPGFAADAALRGFSSDHSTDLALWVDGVPINEPVNGHAEGYNDWAVLFPGGIQDIDVIHGPTSALFGNFALAGVVNVRTIERMRGTEVDGKAGSFGGAEAMVLTGFDHGARGGGVVGARYAREDGFRPSSGYDVAQGHARIVHDLKPGWRIDGGVELYGGRWSSPGFLSDSEFASHQYHIVSNPTDGGFKRRAQERVGLRALMGTVLWRTTAYATQGRWQLFLTIPPAGGVFEGSGSQTEEEDSRDGYGGTTAFTWANDRSEVTLGGEARWDQSHYQNYFTTARARDSVAALVTGRQILGAPFLQSYVDLGSRLRLDAGARYDVFATRSVPSAGIAVSADHGVFSPKAGALLHLTSNVSAYANASRGFRAPNGIILDPTLDPITALAYESGLKLDRDGIVASAALFRMDVSNEQTFNPATLESSNGGASRRQGIELDWSVPVVAELATVSGDWTFNDARYRRLTSAPSEGGDPPAVLDGQRVYNTSKYIGTSALDIARAGAPWRLRLAGNWVGGYSPFDRPGVVLSGYGIANVSGTWAFHAVEANVGVRNLFDRAYPELVAGQLVSPGQPRTIFMSARAIVR